MDPIIFRPDLWCMEIGGQPNPIVCLQVNVGVKSVKGMFYNTHSPKKDLSIILH